MMDKDALEKMVKMLNERKELKSYSFVYRIPNDHKASGYDMDVIPIMSETRELILDIINRMGVGEWWVIEVPPPPKLELYFDPPSFAFERSMAFYRAAFSPSSMPIVPSLLESEINRLIEDMLHDLDPHEVPDELTDTDSDE